MANDYNPNIMATSEKKLLQRSLQEDGFTQPVVVSDDKGQYIVVDGFTGNCWVDAGVEQGNALKVGCLSVVSITTGKDRLNG